MAKGHISPRLRALINRGPQPAANPEREVPVERLTEDREKRVREYVALGMACYPGDVRALLAELAAVRGERDAAQAALRDMRPRLAAQPSALAWALVATIDAALTPPPAADARGAECDHAWMRAAREMGHTGPCKTCAAIATGEIP